MDQSQQWRLRPRQVEVVEPLRDESGAVRVDLVASPRLIAPINQALGDALLFVDGQGRAGLALVLPEPADPPSDPADLLGDLPDVGSLPAQEIDRGLLTGTWLENGVVSVAGQSPGAAWRTLDGWVGARR